MVDERTLNCLRESEIDTIEVSLRKKMEDSLSKGKISEADVIEDTIKSLDNVNICDESTVAHFRKLAGL